MKFSEKPSWNSKSRIYFGIGIDRRLKSRIMTNSHLVLSNRLAIGNSGNFQSCFSRSSLCDLYFEYEKEQTILLIINTVKLAREKLPAKAASKLIRRLKYLRIQAKISAGNDCLRFLRVTGGNLPAPAGNSHEVFIIRVRADFFKPRDVSFYPVPNTLTKVTVYFLRSQWWTFQIWFCSKSVEVFFADSSNQYPKKPLAEKVFTTIKRSGTGCCHLNLKGKKLLNGSYRAT